MPSSPITSHDVRIDDGLVAVLATVPDPRDARGVRYPLAGMLAIALCAVLAGARSFTAIGEWAGELHLGQLTRLGLRRAPVESTLRKLFARLDAGTLDRIVTVTAWARTRHVAGRRVIAIDGKTVRGARNTADGTTAPHLVAALDHHAGVVLGQLRIDAKSNEIPAVRDLLASFDPAALRGSVLTIDAMHTQDDTATAILNAGADYVLTVKGNRPTLHRALKTLPWGKVPVGTRDTERAHGRTTSRTIKLLDAPRLPDWPEFPGAAQIAQVRRTSTRGGRRTVEVVYIVTSAKHRDAPPAVLAAWVRGHWAIENALHWVRDVTFAEDLSRVRTGNAPQVMATLRNTAIGILRLAGWDNIAEACRHHARQADRAITRLLTS